MITLTPVNVFVGIDPGPQKTGTAIILDNGIDAPKIAWADLVQSGRVPDTITRELRTMGIPMGHYGLAIEEIRSYGMAVGQTTFDTCVLSGAIHTGLYLRYPPSWSVWLGRKADVCVTICGSTRAKDANIRQAMIDLYGPPGTKKDPGGTYGITADMWSAVALATTSARYCRSAASCPETVKQGFCLI